MSVALGKSSNLSVTQRVRLYSLSVTPAAGQDATLKVYRASDTNAGDPLVIKAADKSTFQGIWSSGIEYVDGFTIVPTNAESYTVEYA